MAAAYLKAILGVGVDVRSAGTEPATHVAKNVVTVMLEEGVDLSRATPRAINAEELRHIDRVVSMGCDVGNVPRVDEDWALDDVDDLSLDELRVVRDKIKRLTLGLAGSIRRNEFGLSGELVAL